MKKTYKAPNILIAKIKVQHHLCAESEVGIGKYNGGSIESRRRGSDWEDDDEE